MHLQDFMFAIVVNRHMITLINMKKLLVSIVEWQLDEVIKPLVLKPIWNSSSINIWPAKYVNMFILGSH